MRAHRVSRPVISCLGTTSVTHGSTTSGTATDRANHLVTSPQNAQRADELPPIQENDTGLDRPLRVLIVSDSASLRFGGEAALPLHYFRFMLGHGEPCRLIVHERCQSELNEHFPDAQDKIHYLKETGLDRFIWRLRSAIPGRLGHFTFGLLLRLITQMRQRKLVKQVVKEHRIDLVHQPTPVSPREPSALFGLRVPLVIGPMNGGMDYPEPFRQMQSRSVDFGMWCGRLFSNLLNRLVPGKRQAQTLLVANQRTNLALPSCLRGQVLELVENGVDMSVWRSPERPSDMDEPDRPTRFVYLGRLVDWKAVTLLLDAFGRAVKNTPMVLEIIGDGEEREALEKQAKDMDLPDNCAIHFTGWLSQQQCAHRLVQADALVLPSLLECGGAVVLEAMAVGLPAIATRWGGPVDYLDESCGILVEPSSHEDFIQGLADAMTRLASSPKLRKELGQAGLNKVIEQFDWDTKGKHMLNIYRDTYLRFYKHSRTKR